MVNGFLERQQVVVRMGKNQDVCRRELKNKNEYIFLFISTKIFGQVRLTLEYIFFLLMYCYNLDPQFLIKLTSTDDVIFSFGDEDYCTLIISLFKTDERERVLKGEAAIHFDIFKVTVYECSHYQYYHTKEF